MNRKDKRYKLLIVFLLICIFGIGYAAIESNLSINGTANFKGNTFDVHFENVTIKYGSVEINTTAGESTATIEPTNRTRVDYTITLSEPGDFYEFTVDVVNAGSIDAMINLVTSKMNGTEITTLPSYLEYNVTYVDGMEIEQYHMLNHGKKETYKVRVAFKTDIDPSDLPSSDTTLNFSYEVQYVQKTSSAIEKPVAYIYTISHEWQQLGEPFTTTSSPDAETAMSEFGYDILLRHRVEDDVITESYLGFKVGNTTYYLRGGVDETGKEETPIYDENSSTLLSAFGPSSCTVTENGVYGNERNTHCSKNNLLVYLYPYGYVYATKNTSHGCFIYDEGGYSTCSG